MEEDFSEENQGNFEENRGETCEEEDPESYQIPQMGKPETVEELFSKIPINLMETDDHPLCKLVEKADDSIYQLSDALDEMTLVLQNFVTKVDIFPQASIDNPKIEETRAHFDGIYNIK